MTILRLLGSSDDKEKEKIGVARPEGCYSYHGWLSKGLGPKDLGTKQVVWGIWRLDKVWDA